MKDGSGQGCVWGDYDNDGFLDLFVARVNQLNLLYHNNRDGTFTRMTNAPFSKDVAISQGCSWGDYDNDGTWIFLCAITSGWTPRHLSLPKNKFIASGKAFR